MQQVACLRCRKQKLRCSRDTPTCRRCDNSGNDCTYPSPPDRKFLAAERRRRRDASNSQASSDSPEQCEMAFDSTRSIPHSLPSTCCDGYARCLSTGTRYDEPQHCSPSSSEEMAFPAEFLPTPTERAIPTPPTAIAMMLIEIYSSRLYWHTSLIVHIKNVVSNYLAGTIDPALSFSIFAVASISLRPSLDGLLSEDSNVDPSVSQLALQDWSKHGHAWATFASEQALKHADIPSIETIQAYQNLSIYWFAVDQIERANFHEDLAYRTCRRLKLHSPLATNDSPDPFLAEGKRRCFWGCWASLCFNQHNSVFNDECWKEAEGLPLPSSEVSYNAGRPVVIETFEMDGNILKINPHMHKSLQPSLIAELMKLYGLWWEVQKFVRQNRQCHSNSTAILLSDYLCVEKRLKTVYRSIPWDFRYDSDTQFRSPAVDPYGLFLLNSLYCLCACVLYSSIEPILSACSADTQITSQVLFMSGPEAIKHSKLMAEMSVAFLETGLDHSRLSPVIGYSAFISCFVRVSSYCLQQNPSDHNFNDLTGAMDVLKRLKEYWHPLQRLWLLLGEFGSEYDQYQRYTAPLSSNLDKAQDPLEDIVEIIGRPQGFSPLKLEPQQPPFPVLAMYSENFDFSETGLQRDGEVNTNGMDMPIYL